ncbi:MAG: M48 family metallopeptidase [Bacteroidales bacterium]|jgi:heat shock protein HtpX|nr:M48 family metallopeptidase [Bacteroidales bacterium]MCB9028821.1 M48 family metallopeptidase [Bacteroidales bacterium]MDD3737245.1 M48 family metallopeptidase [Bacteroidales bacterium]NLD64593.1 M48 family metallopeptidase [Bacteroidales bacterium]HNT93714.1 M48 family metallopeptidase [Bacteroidales bacterium]
MRYTGLNRQIWNNNIKSVILLTLFPLVILGLVWLFVFLLQPAAGFRIEMANQMFIRSIPWVLIGVFLWFIIAWFSHSAMIQRATDSAPLSRKENKRIYNMVENLCIASGMPMPRVNIINDDSLNAFASGIKTSNFTVALSRGIIDRLNDEELEAVIAHELTHIRNRDVRLLIISIIFVGIFAFITEALVRSVRFSGSSSGRKDGRVVIIALLLAAVGYFLSSVFRFAISRQREYMADAGSATMTKNPLALASALEKISTDAQIEAVRRNDVAQMFIDNPQDKKIRPVSFPFGFLFMTHPPIEKRIALLKQF